MEVLGGRKAAQFLSKGTMHNHTIAPQLPVWSFPQPKLGWVRVEQGAGVNGCRATTSSSPGRHRQRRNVWFTVPMCPKVAWSLRFPWSDGMSHSNQLSENKMKDTAIYAIWGREDNCQGNVGKIWTRFCPVFSPHFENPP